MHTVIINEIKQNYDFARQNGKLLFKEKSSAAWRNLNVADVWLHLQEKGYSIGKSELKTLLESSHIAPTEESSPQAAYDESAPVAVRLRNYLLSKYDFRFEVIAQEPEFTPKGTDQWKRIDDWEVNNLMLELESMGFKPTEQTVPRLLFSQFTPRYNVLENYLQSLPAWDGKDYFGELVSYIEFESEKEKNRFAIHLKKHFIRWIKCALEEGYFNKQAIVLVGKQNDGKTSLIRWLLPKQLKDYIKENPDTSKDGKIEFARNLLINYDEMASIERNVIEEVKHMFSQEFIKERPPFMRRSIKMKRYASIFGSTNHYNFLKDSTGNSRFLCFVIQQIYHPRNPRPDGSHYEQLGVDNLWVQAYQLYQDGKTAYELTPEEIRENETVNRRHLLRTDAENMIQMFFEPRPEIECNDFLTASEINIRLLKYITEIYGIKPNLNLNAVATGRAMTALGFQQASRRMSDNGMPAYGYYVYDRMKDGMPAGTVGKIEQKQESTNTENTAVRSQSGSLPF